MPSTSNNGNEPPPSEEEDRSLLFGPRKEGTEPAGGGERPRPASASPPPGASPPAAEAVADRAAGVTELAAAARTITRQAEQIGAATEWVNDVKASMSTILASTGKLIKGLESGNKDLDGALAQLKIVREGLDKVEKSLGATAKGLDRRSSELGAVKQELARYYEAWTAEAKTSRDEMKALSKRLGAGDHMVTRVEKSIGPWTERMEESIEANSAAQRDTAAKTADNVEKLAATGTRFLNDFGTARRKALKEARQEWTRIRRWTVPALAIALVLAAPSFAVVGAIGQSEFGVFDPYDDTLGWKQGVWERHGLQVKDCMQDSLRTNQVIRCSFDVEYP